MVLKAIYASDGYVISVSDNEIRNSVILASKLEGIFLCPEAAAVVPGLQKLIKQGIISDEKRIVIMGTGSGLKYHDSLNTPNLEILNH
jgi:threonine synthase